MEEIKIIDGIEYYEENGTIYLKLETCAKGLGFTKKASSGNEVVHWTRVRKYLADLGVVQKCTTNDFIPENIFYRLAMKAKNEIAEEFQAKIADEVIPSIRKHGAYMTEETIEKALTSPDFLIQLATKLKEEQEARKLAEEKLAYKEEVLEGLTDNISLADKRRRINQIVRKGSKNPTHLGARWNMLYREFELKHHMNLDARLKSAAYASISPKNKLDLIDKGMGMIDELYEVCCKLYESDYEKVLKEIEMVCA